MSRKNKNARSVQRSQRSFGRGLISQPVQGQVAMNEVPIPATGKIACDASCSYEYMRLPAAWLVTDTSYQRAIDERAVERIVENWLEAALQLRPAAGERGEGQPQGQQVLCI